MTIRNVRKSRVASPLKIIFFILLLLLAFVTGYRWLFHSSRTAAHAPQIPPQTKISVETPTIVSTHENTSLVPEENDNFEGAEYDLAPLPPDVIDQTFSVGDSLPEPKRVIIDSDIVDTLLGDTTKTLISDSSMDVIPFVDENVFQEQKIEPSESAIGMVESTENMFFQQASTTKNLFLAEQQKLKALSPQSYTIQLAELNSSDDVLEFVSSHQLTGKVRVYVTVKDSVDKYMVIYNNYANIRQALDAIDMLPESLQVLAPWAKSLRQVHKEIELAK